MSFDKNSHSDPDLWQPKLRSSLTPNKCFWLIVKISVTMFLWYDIHIHRQKDRWTDNQIAAVAMARQKILRELLTTKWNKVQWSETEDWIVQAQRVLSVEVNHSPLSYFAERGKGWTGQVVPHYTESSFL